MRYVIYGDDAVSHQPRDPLVLEAASEAQARDRAVARGMAVRAVIAEPAPPPAVELAEPKAVLPRADSPRDEPPPDSAEMRGLRRFMTLVVLPLVVTFFLLLAVVRTLFEAAAWTVVWCLGLLLGGGLGGLLTWLSGGQVPAETAWPIGLVVGLVAMSAIHGAQVGWRWWWAKRSLGPLAQALGMMPESADAQEPSGLRVPVLLAQALAGTVLGGMLALVGWATDWGWPTVVAGPVGGAIGMGLEGAILGAVLARRRPMPVPGASAGPSFESLAGVLARLWGEEHIAPSWVLGYALDRAAPGAAAGLLVGVLAFALGWWVVG